MVATRVSILDAVNPLTSSIKHGRAFLCYFTDYTDGVPKTNTWLRNKDIKVKYGRGDDIMEAMGQTEVSFTDLKKLDVAKTNLSGRLQLIAPFNTDRRFELMLEICPETKQVGVGMLISPRTVFIYSSDGTAHVQHPTDDVKRDHHYIERRNVQAFDHFVNMRQRLEKYKTRFPDWK